MENTTLGEIKTIIVFFATLFTSGGVIIAVASKILKNMIVKQITPLCNSMQGEIKKIQEDNNKIHEELKRNSLNTMKNTICNKDIPITERISVGKEYIDNGGNGAIKILVHTLEEEYEKNLKEK